MFLFFFFSFIICSDWNKRKYHHYYQCRQFGWEYTRAAQLLWTKMNNFRDLLVRWQLMSWKFLKGILKFPQRLSIRTFTVYFSNIKLNLVHASALHTSKTNPISFILLNRLSKLSILGGQVPNVASLPVLEISWKRFLEKLIGLLEFICLVIMN